MIKFRASIRNISLFIDIDKFVFYIAQNLGIIEKIKIWDELPSMSYLNNLELRILCLELFVQFYFEYFYPRSMAENLQGWRRLPLEFIKIFMQTIFENTCGEYF